jgi:hypothetical protein
MAGRGFCLEILVREAAAVSFVAPIAVVLDTQERVSGCLAVSCWLGVMAAHTYMPHNTGAAAPSVGMGS